MNRSWNKNSSNSPGFVYFNQDIQTETGTTDFIPFQDSSKQNYQHSSHYGSPKFHSSPRKYNNRNNFRHSGGNRAFYSPNCSNTSWHDKKQYKQSYHKKKSLFNNSVMMSADGKRDMSLFYDFTCTSNPWEGLEQKIELNDPVENLDGIKIDENKTAITIIGKKESSSSDEESSSTEESSSSNQEYEHEET